MDFLEVRPVSLAMMIFTLTLHIIKLKQICMESEQIGSALREVWTRRFCRH